MTSTLEGSVVCYFGKGFIQGFSLVGGGGCRYMQRAHAHVSGRNPIVPNLVSECQLPNANSQNVNVAKFNLKRFHE